MKLTLCYLVLAASAVVGEPAGSEPLSGALRRAAVPAPPIYSGDGSVVIHSSQARAGYRGPVLLFVNRVRELFQSGMNLKVGSQNCPLEIRIGDKSDGDTAVLTARLRDARGRLREVIELPDPEAADLERLRRAVAVAFLRAWMVDAGGTDATMRDLPNWLIDGAVRYMQGTHRQEDLDRTYLLWSHAALPPAEQLYAFESRAAETEPAVAAALAGWFLEKRGHAFKSLLRETALGREWSPANVAERLAEGFSGNFDRMLDLRMLDLGRRVIQPGITTEGIVRRFRSELLLFPTDYGMMFSQTNSYCSFDAALRGGESDAIRQAARFQALRLRAAAAGRDGTLLALAGEYETFLLALSEGVKPERLEELLQRAEESRRALEKSVAGGQALMQQ